MKKKRNKKYGKGVKKAIEIELAIQEIRDTLEWKLKEKFRAFKASNRIHFLLEYEGIVLGRPGHTFRVTVSTNGFIPRTVADLGSLDLEYIGKGGLLYKQGSISERILVECTKHSVDRCANFVVNTFIQRIKDRKCKLEGWL